MISFACLLKVSTNPGNKVCLRPPDNSLLSLCHISPAKIQLVTILEEIENLRIINFPQWCVPGAVTNPSPKYGLIAARPSAFSKILAADNTFCSSNKELYEPDRIL